MNVLLGLVLGAVFLVLEAATAHANMAIGSGLICDTAEQIEQVVSFGNSGLSLKAAVQEVNAGTSACGIAPVLYEKGETLNRLRSPQGLVDVVQITVYAVMQEGMPRPIPPLVQFTFFSVVGQEI